MVSISLLVIVASFCSSASAQIDWFNTTGSPDPLFHVGGNWAGGSAPTATKAARFNLAGSYDVWFNSATAASLPAIGGMQVLDGNITFLNVDSSPQHKLSVNGSALSPAIAISGSTASLTLRGIQLESLSGAEITGGATVNVDGSHAAGSRWTVMGGLTNIDGQMNLLSGGIANDQVVSLGTQIGVSGNGTVSGSGSQWGITGDLFVGELGFGTLTIDDGGIVNSGGTIVGSDGTGTLTVRGAGSRLNTNSIGFGLIGTGDLIVENGGVVSSNSAEVSDGITTVSGTDSQWINNGAMAVGRGGLAQVNVLSGASVTNGNGLEIGAMASGVGSVTIDGSGSVWTESAQVVVGQSGSGQLTVSNSGFLGTSSSVIGEEFGANGTATIQTGSGWINNGNMIIGASGVGTLNVRDSSAVTVIGNSLLGEDNNGNMNIESGGTVTTSGNAILGFDDFMGTSFGGSTVNVTGAGSRWGIVGTLTIAESGPSNMTVGSGGLVTNTSARIGFDASGGVTVTGDGSRWANSAGLIVGSGIASGTLTVSDGGIVESLSGSVVGSGSATTTATVSGVGSRWEVTNDIQIESNASTTLSAINGGVITSTNTLVDNFSGISGGGNGISGVGGSGSRWETSGQLSVGINNTGHFTVNSGGVATSATGAVGISAGSNGVVTVTGGGSLWDTNQLEVGREGTGTLDILSGGVALSSNATLGMSSGSSGTVNVDGAGSQWDAGFLTVGDSGTGILNITSEGVVNSGSTNMGLLPGSSGQILVDGSGSVWNNSGRIDVGLRGGGILTISNGGQVTNTDARIADEDSGSVTVSGAGSMWTNADLTIGDFGISSFGSLNVNSGGIVNNANAVLANFASTGTALVTGAGSQWNSSGNLTVDVNGVIASVTTADNGLISVGGTTTIGANGLINVNGGRLEFGTMSLNDFGRINASSGSLAGNVVHTEFTDVSTFTVFDSTTADFTDVAIENRGTLVGSDTLLTGLANAVNGEVRTISGEQLRFIGAGRNFGEMNNFGGIVRFEEGFTNESTGFIGGRGIFTYNGGILNEGVMAFSSGTADIQGDVDLAASGRIVTSGFGTTTLFDDLDHNGAEIRTSNGSAFVVFGEATGAGSYTGSGTVFFEGDLRPGNSPDIVNFEGDVVLGSFAETFIELAGTDAGMFDALLIDGNFDIAGILSVDLIDGFVLSANEQFLIAEIGGVATGQFDGLGEQSLVGTFGGKNLFITYGAGDGNDIGLFTAVPEPTGGLLMCLMISGMLARRRKS